MKRLLLMLITISLAYTSLAQQAVDVMESTLKLPAVDEIIFHYGFAEGDQVLISLEEINGKELKEFEVTELPDIPKFMEYKTSKINKTLTILRTGIYKFRLTNSSIAGRICRFKIQRIPSSNTTSNFNTSVYWRTVSDTTNLTVPENYVERSDTSIVQVTDQVVKVSSQNAANGNPNRNLIAIDLPQGTSSWSYFIGTGNEGKAAFDQSREKLLQGSAAVLSKLQGYGPMAALALFGVNYFSKLNGEDNVKYWFMSGADNAILFNAGKTFYQFKTGDIVSEASQMKTPKQGRVYLGLVNDNLIEPIHVMIKVTAITVINKIGTRTVQRKNITSRQEPYLKN